MAKKFFCTLILVSLAFTLFSETKTLSEIDVLIAETRYDQALDELHKYIKENPENFDNAQIRVGRIMEARRKYTQLADELIHLIMEDPGNSEQIYRVTSELESLEKYPSDKQLDFIRETRIAAEFNFFRKELERILDESEKLAKGKNYVAAAQKSLEGFPLYQDAFFKEWTDEKISRPVRDAIIDINSCLTQYSEIQKRLTDCVAEFIRAVKSEKSEDMTKSYETVRTVFGDFAKIRNKIYEAGQVFRDTDEHIREVSDNEFMDASFLSFVMRFTFGQNGRPLTGIAGAIDTQWNELCDSMKVAATEKLDNYILAFEKSLPEKIYADEKEKNKKSREDSLTNARKFSNSALQVNSLYDSLKPKLNENEIQKFSVACNYSHNLLLNINLLFEEKNTLEGKISNVAKISVPQNPADEEMKGSKFINNFLDSIIDVIYLSDEKSKLNLEEANWASDFRKTGGKENLVAIEKKYSNYLSEIYATADSCAENSYSVLSNYLKTCGNDYVAQSKNDYKMADDFYKGVTNENAYTVERYPTKALTSTENLQNQVDRQVAVIDRHLNFIPGITEQKFISEISSVLQNDRRELLSLKTNAASLASLCKTQIQNAERVLNEALLRYSQAENALKTDDFEMARRRLQESRAKYNESLAISFSTELQNSSDERLQLLGEKINQKENEIVVRDVRNLKTRAKNEYYAGNFEEAENLLNQAKNRWAVTNVEDDAEIINLLAIINTALSMKTGRVILPSAPLYPEMSQILSIASQYYDEGSRLISTNKRKEGEKVLRSALQKLQELQLVYPLNQDASLLSLRIQKVLDANEFDAMFARKVSEAKMNYKRIEKQQETYTDLLDLYEIDPNYPGLKNLIYNVELEIGIRQKPVDNSASIKSASLTREAEKIVNAAGRDEAKLRQALEKLDEAISLNSNNDDAIRLKDRIQISIGGKAAVVLSAEDETKYQMAIQELQRNNIITANSIVEQLLQKQSNKNSAKILELQKKIKALL